MVKIPPITIIIDTREQKPLDFIGLPVVTEVGKVYPGDYTVKGFESSIAFERKSVNDLIGTLKNGYKPFRSVRRMEGRFNRELDHMRRFCACSWLFVEPDDRDRDGGFYHGTAEDEIYCEKYKSLMPKASVFGFLRQLRVAYNVQVYLAKSRSDAAREMVEVIKTFIADVKQIVPRGEGMK